MKPVDDGVGAEGTNEALTVCGSPLPEKESDVADNLHWFPQAWQDSCTVPIKPFAGMMLNPSVNVPAAVIMPEASVCLRTYGASTVKNIGVLQLGRKLAVAM
jgi:hypothetical protein